MVSTVVNPCPRCGTARIVAKTWTELVGKNTLTMTQTACPDPACQKKVELENTKLTNKRLAYRKKDEPTSIAKESPVNNEKTNLPAQKKNAS